MSSSYSSLDWVLSHWVHFTVCRFIYVYLCILCFFVNCIFVVHSGVDLMGLKSFLMTCLPSVLWHCWLGHLTCKNPSPIWPIMCWRDVSFEIWELFTADMYVCVCMWRSWAVTVIVICHCGDFPSVLWHCWFGHMTCKNRPQNDL